MVARRRLCLLAAALAACCLAAVALVVNGGATATTSPLPAVNAEMQRAGAAPGATVPVFAVVRNGSKLVVVRGTSTRAGLGALTQRLHALPGVLSAEQELPVHIATTDDPLFSQQWALEAVD